MTYQTNRDLPTEAGADVGSDRAHLSEAAQKFYWVAYNSALQWYGEESRAHQIAWSAIRNQSASLNSAIS